MPRVYSRRKGATPPPPEAVYVGRPTKWGNPFVVGTHGAQGECVELYREWIAQPEQAAPRIRRCPRTTWQRPCVLVRT